MTKRRDVAVSPSRRKVAFFSDDGSKACCLVSGDDSPDIDDDDMKSWFGVISHFIGSDDD
jgi:hypothetical protein